VADLLLEGRAGLQRQDAAAAATAFSAATALDGTSVLAWHGLALALSAAGDRAGAISAADNCLRLDPSSLRTLILRADLTFATGNRRGAASYYQKAVAAARGQSVPADLQPDLRRAALASEQLARELAGQLHDSLRASSAYDASAARRIEEAVSILSGTGRIWPQEPRYFYLPGLAAIPFHDRSAFPWLEALEARTDPIEEELRGILVERAGFSAYVKSDPNRPGRTQKGLVDNPDWSASFLIRNGQRQGAVAARCPQTLAALDGLDLPALPGRSPSVLFSLLEPGMHIPPHTGMINTRLIVHLPLIVPPGCSFRVGPQTRDWQRGRAWVFDDTIEHEAWNRSGDVRVILLFEIWNPAVTPAERILLHDMFAALDRDGGGPDPGWHI
jgi:aspartate beta-hydroxylase